MSTNDPLAGLTPKWIFERCIWISGEDTNTRIMLLCILRFMDHDLRGSSMSYSQIARDCGFTELTAKRCAKKVRARWLKVEVGKGRYVPGKGSENLYHGVIPEDLVDELRRQNGVSHRYPDGVSQGYPEGAGYLTDTTGVSQGYKRGISQIPPGYPTDTRTNHTNQTSQNNNNSALARASGGGLSDDEISRDQLEAYFGEHERLTKLKSMTFKQRWQAIGTFCRSPRWKGAEIMQMLARDADEVLQKFDREVAAGRQREDALFPEDRINPQEEVARTQELLDEIFPSIEERIATLEWCGVLPSGLDELQALRLLEMERGVIRRTDYDSETKYAKLRALIECPLPSEMRAS